MESQTLTCPECGASRINGLDCFGQLGQIGVWEYNDSELLAEHFLTVASYNLQHPAKFTEAAIEGLRTVFLAYLKGEMGVSEIRKKVAYFANGKARVLKPKADRQNYKLKRWPLTIASVYLENQPAGAATRVRTWAQSIAQEL